MTLHPLTLALAGQMASERGEMIPRMNTGTNDDLPCVALPLPRCFPITNSVTESVCIFVSNLSVSVRWWQGNVYVGGDYTWYNGPNACASLGILITGFTLPLGVRDH